MNEYPPSVPLARLYERTSRNGNTYLSGLMGLARIAVLKTADTDSDGNPIWTLIVSEAPRRDKVDQPAEEARERREKGDVEAAAAEPGRRASAAKRDWQAP